MAKLGRDYLGVSGMIKSGVSDLGLDHLGRVRHVDGGRGVGGRHLALGARQRREELRVDQRGLFPPAEKQIKNMVTQSPPRVKETRRFLSPAVIVRINSVSGVYREPGVLNGG